LLTWKEKTDVEKLDCSDNATNCVDFETQMKRKTKLEQTADDFIQQGIYMPTHKMALEVKII
jgi:hypothetical protein